MLICLYAYMLIPIYINPPLSMLYVVIYLCVYIYVSMYLCIYIYYRYDERRIKWPTQAVLRRTQTAHRAAAQRYVTCITIIDTIILINYNIYTNDAYTYTPLLQTYTAARASTPQGQVCMLREETNALLILIYLYRYIDI
jgi:membrane-bound metal-dependent hydrolase YbcI (DUF457 family)